MNDVPVSEGSVLATQKARVLLIHEQAQMRAQPTVLVAQPFDQRRMRLHQCFKSLSQRPRVERELTRSAREIPVCAVEKDAHTSTTNGSCHRTQPSDAFGPG